MHRIDSATARQNLNGAGKNGFHDNADLPNQDATYLTPAWCNTVQEEVANVIEGFGGALDKLDNKQLLNILTATFAKNTALQNAVDDYSDKFAQQGSRILAVENRIYEDTKVGDVFVTTTHFDTSAQVAIHKGYGTWTREAEGRAIVGYSSQADSPEWTKINGNLYGEDKVQLTIQEMPDHKHKFVSTIDGTLDISRQLNILGLNEDIDYSTIQFREFAYSPDNVSDSAFLQSTKAGVGGDKPHNNVQLSKIYNVWRRIA